MSKKLLAILIACILVLCSMPVFAADEPVIFKSTITVTEKGGEYEVGFAQLDFKKSFLDKELLPATFEVEIYAENGVAYIAVSPDTPLFNKAVHIKADNYEGLLYDKAAGKNIMINIGKQQILAEHFSRYAFQ